MWDILPGKTLLVDVAVISSFVKKHRDTIVRSGAGYAATEYEKVKEHNYRLLDRTQYELFASIIESSGAFGLKLRNLLQLLRKFDLERNMRPRHARSPGLGIDNLEKSIVVSVARSLAEAVLQRGPPHWRLEADSLALFVTTPRTQILAIDSSSSQRPS